MLDGRRRGRQRIAHGSTRGAASRLRCIMGRAYVLCRRRYRRSVGLPVCRNRFRGGRATVLRGPCIHVGENR